MENCKKYERQYFMPPKFEYDWVKKDYVDAPPLCGNGGRAAGLCGQSGAALICVMEIRH